MIYNLKYANKNLFFKDDVEIGLCYFWNIMIKNTN